MFAGRPAGAVAGHSRVRVVVRRLGLVVDREGQAAAGDGRQRAGRIVPVHEDVDARACGGSGGRVHGDGVGADVVELRPEVLVQRDRAGRGAGAGQRQRVRAPGASSVILTVAVRLPVALGVNVTESCNSAARSYGRSAVIGLGEVAAVGAGDRDAGDAQGGAARIAQRDRLGGARGGDVLAGERQARRRERTPARRLSRSRSMPRCAADPVALSVMLTVALRAPGRRWVNVTESCNCRPLLARAAGIGLAQSPPLAPVIAMLVMLRAALPVVNVIVWAALVVPTRGRTSRLDGESDAWRRLSRCRWIPRCAADPVALSVMLTVAAARSGRRG